MKKSNHLILIVCLLVILGTGLYLRVKNYASVPFPGDSVDEYSFAWLGLSLIETGTPIATSGLSPYQHQWKYINVDNFYQRYYTPNPFPIDQPWFDHPPLFSLIPGGFAYLKAVRDFADASVVVIRKPMVALGTVNIILVFALASLIFNKKVGLVASLIYASEPLIVISSRMAQAENFLITLFLASLISLLMSYKSNKGWWFWLAVSLAGLATLVKLSGWSIALSLALITQVTVQKTRWQKTAFILAGSCLIFLFFPAMGLIYNAHLFQEVLLQNSARFYRDGLNVMFNLLTKQNITRDFASGWVPLGWIALSLLLTKLKDTKFWWVAAPIICYLFVYLVFGSESYGWYKLPFWPFLTTATAAMFIDTYANPHFFYNLWLIFLPAGVMLNRFINPQNLQPLIWPFRLFIILIFALTLLPWIFPKQGTARAIYQICLTAILVGLITLNIFTVLQTTPEAWDQLNWLRSV